MATENKFTLRQGYAGNITITIKDADGAVVDLSGATIYFVLKNRKSDTTALLTKDSNGDITVTSATGGIIDVAFTQAETLALTKNATAEVIIKYSTTNVTKTKDIFVFIDKGIRATAV